MQFAYLCLKCAHVEVSPRPRVGAYHRGMEIGRGYRTHDMEAAGTFADDKTDAEIRALVLAEDYAQGVREIAVESKEEYRRVYQPRQAPRPRRAQRAA